MTDINTTSQHFLQLANVLQQLLLKRLLVIALKTSFQIFWRDFGLWNVSFLLAYLRRHI